MQPPIAEEENDQVPELGMAKRNSRDKRAAFSDQVQVNPRRLLAHELEESGQVGGGMGMSAPVAFDAPIPFQRPQMRNRDSQRNNAEWRESVRKSLAMQDPVRASRALRQSARFILGDISKTIGQRDSLAQGRGASLSMDARLEELEELLQQKEESLELAAEIGQQLALASQQTEEQLEELQNKYEAMTQEYNLLSSQYKVIMVESRTEIQSLRMENDDLRAEAREVDELNATYEHELERLKDERQQLMREVSSLQVLRHKAEQVDELTAANEELEQLVGQLEGDLEKYTSWEEQWEQARTQYDDVINQLRAENEELASSKESEVARLNKKVEELKQGLEEALEANQLGLMPDSEREGLLSSGDQARIRERMRLLEAEVARLQEYQHTLKEQSEGLESELHTTTEQLNAARAKITEAERTIASQRESLQSWGHKEVEWTTQRKQKDKEIERLKEEVEKLRAQEGAGDEKLQAQLLELNASLVAARDDKARLANDAAALKARVEDLTKEKAALQKVLDDMRQQGDGDLNEQLLSARQQIEKLRLEVEKAVESRNVAREEFSGREATLQQKAGDLTSQLGLAEQRLSEALRDLEALKKAQGPDAYNMAELDKVRKERDALQERLRQAEKGADAWRLKQANTVKNRETRRIPMGDISGIQTLSKQMDELRKRIRELEEENRALQAKANAAELQEAPEELVVLQSENNAVQKQVEELQALVEEKSVSLEQSTRLVGELKADQEASAQGTAAEHLQQEVTRLREKRDAVEKELVDARAELEKLKAKKQRVIDQLKSTVGRLKAENQRWCDCIVAQFEYHRQIFASAAAPEPVLAQ